MHTESATKIPELTANPRHLKSAAIIAVDIVTRPITAPVHRRSRAARARFALITGILGYLVFQAALNLAIQSDWVPVRDPVWFEKFGLLEKRPAFFAAPSDRPTSPIRLMALGSSRTQLAFDATTLGERVASQIGRPVEAFNFGCPAAGAMTCALYLNRLLEKDVKPDYLLIEIHPGFVTRGDPPFESRWLHPYRLRPDEVDRLRRLGWAIESPPQHGWMGWLTSTASYRMSLLNRYAPVMLPCPFGLTLGARTNPDGFVRGEEMPRDRYPRALARTKLDYSPVLTNYQTGGAGAEAIRDMLQQCREHHITAAIMLMPESSEHRAWYGEVGYADVTNFAQGLGHAFGVPVVDAREWLPDEGFADGHHLTGSGADMFTERLAKEFVTPWVTHRKVGR